MSNSRRSTTKRTAHSSLWVYKSAAVGNGVDRGVRLSALAFVFLVGLFGWFSAGEAIVLEPAAFTVDNEEE